MAHRGASAQAPQNTVEAFELAAALGADWVELDVRPVIVSSFDPAMVDRVRQLDDGVPTAQLTFLLERPAAEVVDRIAARGHRWWHPHHATLDADTIAAAHAAGLGVNTWTVDHPARIAELATWKIDGVVTNDVPTALRALGR